MAIHLNKCASAFDLLKCELFGDVMLEINRIPYINKASCYVLFYNDDPLTGRLAVIQKHYRFNGGEQPLGLKNIMLNKCMREQHNMHNMSSCLV